MVVESVGVLYLYAIRQCSGGIAGRVSVRVPVTHELHLAACGCTGSNTPIHAAKVGKVEICTLVFRIGS